MSGRVGVLCIVVLGGCNRNLDSIEGFDLGRAQSAAWAKDPVTERIAVVASDTAAACDLAVEPDPESEWTLWVWSTEPARYEEELGATAFVSIRDGVVDDDFDGDGFLWIDDHNGRLKVNVDVNFGEDRVHGNVIAEECDAQLFPADG